MESPQQLLRYRLDIVQQASGMTKERFAEQIGISLAMYSRWLGGERELGKNALEKVRRLYPGLVDSELFESAREVGRPAKENAA